MDWNGIDSRRAGDHPAVMRRSKLTMNASKRRIEMSERNAKRQASQAYNTPLYCMLQAVCCMPLNRLSFCTAVNSKQAQQRYR